jgi:hypothetical protein
MEPNSWHALLGPLPDGATPRASPVISPTQQAMAVMAPIAGWETLFLELSAGSAGLRILQVTLDAQGRTLSASDHVLFRSAPSDQPGPVHIRQESIGGRLEPDGGFRGTFWLVTGPEPIDEEDAQWELRPRDPTGDEVEALKQLVAEVVRRRPPP